MRKLLILFLSVCLSWEVTAEVLDTIPMVGLSTTGIEDKLQYKVQCHFPLKEMFAPEVKLLFLGDIMGHSPQIQSAYDRAKNRYHYRSVWEDVVPLFQQADWTIGNLEVTLGGQPYTGYPTFSSPDALASSLIDAGVDVLLTANNHCLDRSKKGLIRTLDVLDSLGIRHTGTFRNVLDRRFSNLLILDKHGIRVGLLNYTYGTNGISTPNDVIVNRIDTTQIALDIKQARQVHPSLDYLILVLHWGNEYQQYPSMSQKILAQWCFQQGVDAIIGSHPHVVQPVVYYPETGHLVAYSLGNFVSNQRSYPKDGGLILQLHLIKNSTRTRVLNVGYKLTWVDKYIDSKGKWNYVVRCPICDSISSPMTSMSQAKMKRYEYGISSFMKSTSQSVRDDF